MKINPIDENEYQSRNLWADGVYPCTVIECEETASKNSGDGMFKCKVQLFNENNHTTNLFYYMMAEGKAAWQLRAASEAFGVLDKYKAGDINSDDFYQKSAYAMVGHQDADGTYPAKNVIKGFRIDSPVGQPAVKSVPVNKPKKASAGAFDEFEDIEF